MSDASLRLDLLDQQVVDADGRPIGRVDDVVLAVPPDGAAPAVREVLMGTQALGERLGGPLAGAAARAARRLRIGTARHEPPAVPVEHIRAIGSLVRLRVTLRELPDIAGLERWLAEHLIERLPGTGDARD